MFPFATLLSNYLIFDIYKPADFAYMPSMASYLRRPPEPAGYAKQDARPRRAKGTKISSAVPEPGPSGPGPQHDSKALRRQRAQQHLLCSAENIIGGVYRGREILRGHGPPNLAFMMGMSGDFAYTLLTNPVMPSSASAGLYLFPHPGGAHGEPVHHPDDGHDSPRDNPHDNDVPQRFGDDRRGSASCRCDKDNLGARMMTPIHPAMLLLLFRPCHGRRHSHLGRAIRLRPHIAHTNIIYLLVGRCSCS